MRTTLYGIRLLIDNMIMHDRVYKRKRTEWGESKIARGRTLLKTRDGMGNKFDRCRKCLWQIWEDNLKQSRCSLMIVFQG